METHNAASLYANAALQAKSLDEEEISLHEQIKKTRQNLSRLNKAKTQAQKKYDRVMDSNNRLKEDMDAVATRVAQLQMELVSNEEKAKQQLSNAQIQISSLKALKSNVQESQQIIANDILVTKTVIAELESEHTLAADDLANVSKDAFEAFHRWSLLCPVVNLNLRSENDTIRTMHTISKIAGKLEEYTKLKQLASEIQHLSNVDMRLLEDVSGLSHNYFWDDLLAKLHRHTDHAVNHATTLIADIEELESTRRRLRDLSAELSSSLDADVRVAMSDAEFRAVSLDPESPDGTLLVTRPLFAGNNSIATNATAQQSQQQSQPQQQPAFDLTGLEHISNRLTINEDRSRAAGLARAQTQSKAQVLLAEAQRRHQQSSRAQLRKKLRTWSGKVHVAVGDISMHWCRQALTSDDPTALWGLPNEYVGLPPDKESSQGLGPIAGLSSAGIALAAAETRRLARELQHSVMAGLNRLPAVASEQCVDSDIATAPNATALFNDSAYLGQLLSLCNTALEFQHKQTEEDHPSGMNALGGVYGPGLLQKAVDSLAERVSSAEQEARDREEAEDSFPSASSAGRGKGKISKSSKLTSRPTNRFTIAERLNGRYADVLRLFPVTPTQQKSPDSLKGNVAGTGTVQPSSQLPSHAPVATVATSSLSSPSQIQQAVAHHHHRHHEANEAADTDTFLASEKADIDRVDETQRTVLHLTCRVGLDLLNINVVWQPHFERLKLTAHCLQILGKAIYTIVLNPADVNAILAESSDEHLLGMTPDNPAISKAIVGCMRVEHFPPAIALGLVKKARDVRCRPQLASVPIVINSMFDDTIKVLTFRTASGALITCCLDVMDHLDES